MNIWSVFLRETVSLLLTALARLKKNPVQNKTRESKCVQRQMSLFKRNDYMIREEEEKKVLNRAREDVTSSK